MEDTLDQPVQEHESKPRPLAQHLFPQLPLCPSSHSLVAQKKRKNPLAMQRGRLLGAMALLLLGAGAIVGISMFQVPSGREKWSAQVGHPFFSSPTVVNGMIYVSNDRNAVDALDASSGHIRWSAQLGNQDYVPDTVIPSPVVVNGIVYANSLNASLFALDAHSGQSIWSYHMKMGSRAAPTVANGMVYLNSEGGIVYALDAISGREIWSYETSEPLNASPVVNHGLVYVAGLNAVFAFDAVSGEQKWVQPISEAYAPAVVNSTLYLTTTDGSLYAVDAISGHQKWEASQPQGFTSSPIVVGESIYVSSFAGVFALQRETGSEQWFFPMHGTLAAPTIVNGTLYAGSVNGEDKLYALDASSGHEQWFYQLGSENTSVPALTPTVSGGVIYMGTLNGKLYALLPPG